LQDLTPAADVLYCDAPFGIGYLVAYLKTRLWMSS